MLVVRHCKASLNAVFAIDAVHLLPVKTCALSVTVLLGAPMVLITSSYAAGAFASLLIRWIASYFEYLNANNWKHLHPLIEQTEEKKVSEYMTSSILRGLNAQTLVL